MTQQFLQTYKQVSDWQEGSRLEKAEIVEKGKTHKTDLLHLSAHLIVIDSKNRILSRKRNIDDFRYAGLWTSSIGTHVLFENDYLSTLRDLLPIKKKLEYVGEFRVHDEWENEINGLYVTQANENELPTEFLSDKSFFTENELINLIKQEKTTPHLKSGFELLKRKFF